MRPLLSVRIVLFWLSLLFSQGVIFSEPLPKLQVSRNQRFLVQVSPNAANAPNASTRGEQQEIPFFYLGDTAWELFHRLNREEADRYLAARARQGFTVIQAVALSEVDGHSVPNPYGFLPLRNFDPARPAVEEGPANDYWDHVDYIVDLANQKGLYIGFLPTWGRYWHEPTGGTQPLFNAANDEAYGEFLGKRYKEKGLIWILGGDRVVENDAQKEIIRAMARGLRKGDGGAHLITFHPRGGSGSAELFHNEGWLDFNMRQNGHQAEYTGTYQMTLENYKLEPVKPVIDGEPLYEDHPLSFNPGKLGHSVATDVRRALYWNLFNGAFGHTYGHHSVWQMYDGEKGRSPINNPLMSWYEALEQPGAQQMVFGRKLLLSRPFLTRIPDPSLIIPDRVATSVPGEGRYRFAATRDLEQSYAMIYVPAGRRFSVKTDLIKASKIRAWWFNPRNGEARVLETFVNQGSRTFISPNPGEALDWILVLDDASKKYPAPGKIRL